MDVRELIAAAEPPSMRVDVQAAVLAGRRAQRRRHAMWAVASVVVVVGLTAGLMRLTPDGGGNLVVAVAVCTTAPLDKENGGIATASDPTGKYVVGADGQQRPVLWGPSGRVVIDVAPNSHPGAVNSSGVVVGATDTHAWRYHNGRVEPLAPLAGHDRSSASGINANGDIVGTVSTADGASVAVVWPAGTDTPRPLQADFPAVATGIADDGTVIGMVFPPISGLAPEFERPRDPSTGQAYAWAPDGTGRALEVPSGWASGYPAAVHAGRALGFAFPAPATGAENGLGPVLWDLRTGEATVPSEFTGQPTGTISSGWITFRTTVISAETGQAREIPTPEGADDGSVWPVWLSRDGKTVIGNAAYSGQSAATVWTCE